MNCKIDRFVVDDLGNYNAVRDLKEHHNVLEISIKHDKAFNHAFAKAGKQIIEEYLQGKIEIKDDRTIYEKLKSKLRV